MKDLLICWEHYSLAIFQETFYIVCCDLIVLVINCDHTFASHTSNVIAGDTYIHRIHLNSGSELRLSYSVFNCVYGLININNHATIQTVTWSFTNS